MTTGVFAGTSTRTPTSSIGTTSRSYPAPAARARQGQRSAVEVMSQHDHQQGLPELGPQVSQLGDELHCVVSGLRVALTEQGEDALLEQPCLALGRLTPPTQVSRVDASRQEACGGADDRQVASGVRRVGTRTARGHEPIRLELVEL